MAPIMCMLGQHKWEYQEMESPYYRPGFTHEFRRCAICGRLEEKIMDHTGRWIWTPRLAPPRDIQRRSWPYEHRYR